MVRGPRLLLLDEPLANLDLRSVVEIVSLLRRVCKHYRVSGRILVVAADNEADAAALIEAHPVHVAEVP